MFIDFRGVFQFVDVESRYIKSSEVASLLKNASYENIEVYNINKLVYMMSAER